MFEYLIGASGARAAGVRLAWAADWRCQWTAVTFPILIGGAMDGSNIFIINSRILIRSYGLKVLKAVVVEALDLNEIVSSSVVVTVTIVVVAVTIAMVAVPIAMVAVTIAMVAVTIAMVAVTIAMVAVIVAMVPIGALCCKGKQPLMAMHVHPKHYMYEDLAA
eukprot:jgi/Botrbrau1/4264/Bobra.0390s0004.1